MFIGTLDSTRDILGIVRPDNGDRDNRDIEVIGLDPFDLV